MSTNTGEHKVVWYRISEKRRLYFKVSAGEVASIFVITGRNLRKPVKRGRIKRKLATLKFEIFAYHVEIKMSSWKYRTLLLPTTLYEKVIGKIKELECGYEFEGDEKIMVF